MSKASLKNIHHVYHVLDTRFTALLFQLPYQDLTNLSSSRWTDIGMSLYQMDMSFPIPPLWNDHGIQPCDAPARRSRQGSPVCPAPWGMGWYEAWMFFNYMWHVFFWGGFPQKSLEMCLTAAGTPTNRSSCTLVTLVVVRAILGDWGWDPLIHPALLKNTTKKDLPTPRLPGVFFNVFLVLYLALKGWSCQPDMGKPRSKIIFGNIFSHAHSRCWMGNAMQGT